MFVSTFYSFKGGVGRTLALANVGVQLAQTGRSVLLVDFDLEAPGLDTFDLLRPHKPQQGLLEFVDRSHQDLATPDVADYVYECPGVAKKGGRLWVMPSGLRDDSYGRRLASINWGELYAEHDGYLIFEDLKAQWEERFSPDYVLIDSRTGHTDEAGICTRQLADSVVVFFFPNAQNLEGLSKVVSDIRAEASGPRQKRIHLHFVMSNVPDLDDEDQILAGRISEFRRKLHFRSDPLVIYRYDSLLLLNQSIFTRERPRSRLSKEYQRLATEICRDNPQDREGALAFLHQVFVSRSRRQSELSPSEVARRLEQIETAHPRDGEVLQQLSEVRQREGDLEGALDFLNQALELGSGRPDAFLRRAEYYARLNNRIEAAADIARVLEAERVDAFTLLSAVRLLRKIDPDSIAQVPGSKALRALPAEDQVRIADQLRRDRKELLASFAILERVVGQEGLGVGAHELALTLIGLGRFDEALASLKLLEEVRGPEIGLLFNRAMARWAQDGVPNTTLFQQVVDRDGERDSDSVTANYHQCLAISAWVCGDAAACRRHLSDARRRITHRAAPEFSCWRYLEVPAAMFLDDLKAIESLSAGANVLPEFIEARAAERT